MSDEQVINEQFAFLERVGAPSFQAQYRKNLVGLRAMLAKAEAVAPKKYRGYTVEKLAGIVAEFERLANSTNDELRTHFTRPLPYVTEET